MLSMLPCVDTERSIEAGQIKMVQKEYELRLYKDTLIASTTEYALANVWDVSYKSFSEQTSLLYLHTHRGVHAYKTHVDPDHFVTTFKRIKNDHY